MKKSLMLILLVICIPFSYSIDVEEVGRVPFEIVEESVSEGITRYVYGAGLVASVKDSDIKYYHSDRIQSNRVITDSEGSIKKEFKSLPFGQEISNSGVRYAFATGKELDSSGLYYFGARYYDSDLGRFSSVDPVPSEPAYQYVGNNPLNLVDPSGMDEELPEVYQETFNDVYDKYGQAIETVSDELSLDDFARNAMFGVIYSEKLRRDKGGITENLKKIGRFFTKLIGIEDNLQKSNKFGAGPGHIHKNTALDIWNYYSSNKDLFPEDYLEQPEDSLGNIAETEQNIRYIGVLFTKMIQDWESTQDISQRPEILSTFYNQGYGKNGISGRELVPGGVDINNVPFGLHSAAAGCNFNVRLIFNNFNKFEVQPLLESDPRNPI